MSHVSVKVGLSHYAPGMMQKSSKTCSTHPTYLMLKFESGFPIFAPAACRYIKTMLDTPHMSHVLVQVGLPHLCPGSLHKHEKHAKHTPHVPCYLFYMSFPTFAQAACKDPINMLNPPSCFLFQWGFRGTALHAIQLATHVTVTNEGVLSQLSCPCTYDCD